MYKAIFKTGRWPVKKHTATGIKGNGYVFRFSCRKFRESQDHPPPLKLYNRIAKKIYQRGKGKLEVPETVKLQGEINTPPDTISIYKRPGKPGAFCCMRKGGNGWKDTLNGISSIVDCPDRK
jgi:hypothetical protein